MKEKENQESMVSRKPSEETVSRERSDELSLYIDIVVLVFKISNIICKV